MFRNNLKLAGEKRHVRYVAALMMAVAASVQAQVSISGNVTANAPFQSPVWNAGDFIFVGNTANGTLTIGNGGSVSTVILSSGMADGFTGLVDVNGGVLNVASAIFAGGTDGGMGIIRVRNGATVSTPVLGISSAANSSGEVEVTGGTLHTETVDVSKGPLSVSGGSVVASDWLRVGAIAIPGSLDISGTGSVSIDRLEVFGEFKLRGSGTLTTRETTISGNRFPIEVSGGTWTNTEQFTIGISTRGQLTVSGGSLTSPFVIMSGTTSSVAQLNLNGGVLTTNALSRGALFVTGGTANVTFDGGTLRISENLSPVFVNFTPGSVSLAGGGGTIDTQNHSISNNLGLVGTGRLTKAGSGTLTLSGANTYTGGTTVNSGILSVTGSINHPSSGLDVNGTLRISNNGSVTNGISRVGQTSAGRVEVSGGTWNNTGALRIGTFFDSTLEMTDGSVITATTVGLGSFATTVSKGTLLLNGGTLTTGQIAESVGEGIVIFGGGTLRLSGSQTNLFGSFEPGDVTLAAGGGTIDTQGFAVASSYGLSGAGSLTKIGAGTLTLSGTNSHSGGTIVSGGTLSVAADANLGSADGPLTLNGGRLRGTAFFTTARATTLGPGGGTFISTAGITHDGVISGVGSLTQAGTGTLTLTGANTYTGGTTVSGGTLALANSDVLPETAISLGAATLSVGDGVTETVGPLDVTGAATIHLGSASSVIAFAGSGDLPHWSGTLNVTGTFVSGASLRFGTDANGLSGDQLAQITVNGSGSYFLDEAGYLIDSNLDFATWIAGTFENGTIPVDRQGPYDDFDNDGISNLLEYALDGEDPTVPNASVGNFDGTTLSFTKRPGTRGLTYAIQESADLGVSDDWSEVTGSAYINNDTIISYELPAGPGQNFLRLRVIKN